MAVNQFSMLQIRPRICESISASAENKNDASPDRLAFLGIPSNAGCEADAGEPMCTVLLGDESFAARPWRELQPGDIVRLQGDEVAGADLLLLASSAPDQTILNTACLDGNNEWQQKQTLPVGIDFAAPGFGASLLSAGHFDLENPTGDLEQTSIGTFVPVEGSSTKPAGIARRHMIVQGAVLVYTEWAIGLVAYIGADTKLAQHGGAAAAAAAAEARKADDEEVKARAAAERKKRLPIPIPPAEFEKSTGMAWSEGWTDVPDDGNCMVHAIWQALTKLYELYPELQEGGPDLPSDAFATRDQMVTLLFANEQYVADLRMQFEFWVQEMDISLLLGQIEDFFVLPEEFQQSIIDYNQLWRAGVQEVDYPGIIQKYREAMAQPRQVPGKEGLTYLPLGEHELKAIGQTYQLRIQVMKNDSLDPEAFPRPVDPRTIPPKLIHDINPTARRIVRLMNVNTNHYQIHLPIARS